jgi:cyclopropane-fatty-acyl-phospholipid synthase
MNDFDAPGRYDRIVSIEMFEHMRNYETLLARVAGWLRPEGELFVHVFCHRRRAYAFETEGAGNWMGRHFFTGGIMPSADLLDRFDRHLAVAERWWWDGTHYQRTAEAWLANLDAHRAEALEVLAATYGRADARRWLHRWRVFFLACAELFGFAGGREWGVGHYRLEPAEKTAPAPRDTVSCG